MKTEQIIKKAIKKAGLSWTQTHHELLECKGKPLSVLTVNGFFLSHYFAKAFFGEDGVCKCHGVICVAKKDFNGIDEAIHNLVPAWQYYLKRMVLKKEPLKYLEKFL